MRGIRDNVIFETIRGGSLRCPLWPGGRHFPTVRFVVAINAALCQRCSKFLPPPPLRLLVHSSMSVFTLAFLLLVMFGLWSLVKFRWIPRFFAHLRRNYTASGALDVLIEELEQLELAVKQAVHDRSNRPDLLPVDLQQRSAKLPDLLRR